MTEQVKERKGREGGRWINERPTSEEFAEWFFENMKIDPKLDAKNYVGGVVVIPGVDRKAPTVTGFANGKPIIEEREELAFTPYAKVEARIDYFWDLLDVHDEWVGVVERVTPARLPIDFVHTEEDETKGSDVVHTRRKIRTPSGLTTLAHTMPDGFSISSIPVGNGYSHFLICTTRVAIYDREEYKTDRQKAVPVRSGQGSKQVPLLMGRHTVYADPSSIMKAETGSLGRALGFAGIFVIPGSGVATAEDMLEALSQGAQAPQEASAPQTEGEGPAAPTQPPVRTGAEQQQDDEAMLAKRASELFVALNTDHPAKAEEFKKWAHGRRISKLSDARGATLRGVVKHLEKLTDQAEKSSQQAALGTSPADSSLPEREEPGESLGSGEKSSEEAADVSGPEAEISGKTAQNDA